MSTQPLTVPVPGSPDAVLAAARGHQRAAVVADAGLLAAAVEWAALHEPTDLGDAASWWLAGEAIPLAGDGCPEIAGWAVAEFAAAVGLTTDAGRRLIGQGLELAWRLPTLWEQVQEGRVPAWRARRVADSTMPLNRVAAGFVDRQVAAVAGKISLPQLDRLITEAKVRHEAAERPDPSDPCPTGPDDSSGGRAHRSGHLRRHGPGDRGARPRRRPPPRPGARRGCRAAQDRRLGRHVRRPACGRTR